MTTNIYFVVPYDMYAWKSVDAHKIIAATDPKSKFVVERGKPILRLAFKCIGMDLSTINKLEYSAGSEDIGQNIRYEITFTEIVQAVRIDVVNTKGSIYFNSIKIFDITPSPDVKGYYIVGIINPSDIIILDFETTEGWSVYTGMPGSYTTDIIFAGAVGVSEGLRVYQCDWGVCHMIGQTTINVTPSLNIYNVNIDLSGMLYASRVGAYLANNVKLISFPDAKYYVFTIQYLLFDPEKYKFRIYKNYGDATRYPIIIHSPSGEIIYKYMKAVPYPGVYILLPYYSFPQPYQADAMRSAVNVRRAWYIQDPSTIEFANIRCNRIWSEKTEIYPDERTIKVFVELVNDGVKKGITTIPFYVNDEEVAKVSTEVDLQETKVVSCEITLPSVTTNQLRVCVPERLRDETPAEG